MHASDGRCTYSAVTEVEQKARDGEGVEMT